MDIIYYFIDKIIHRLCPVVQRSYIFLELIIQLPLTLIVMAMIPTVTPVCQILLLPALAR